MDKKISSGVLGGVVCLFVALVIFGDVLIKFWHNDEWPQGYFLLAIIGVMLTITGFLSILKSTKSGGNNTLDSDSSPVLSISRFVSLTFLGFLAFCLFLILLAASTGSVPR